MHAESLLLASLVMAVGAAVQASFGFGAALVAAPLLALVEPSLVPAPVILAALVLNLLVMRRDPGEHAWRSVSWAITGQVPGAVLGAAVLVAVGAGAGLQVMFGVLILLAVGLSVSGLRPAASPGVLFGAGTLSGFMQSTVGAGGPPIALTLQHDDAAELRARLARYFLCSCVVSLTVLALAGQIDRTQVIESAALVPGTVAGFLASGWVARHVDGRTARIAVLGLSTVAALALLAKALV